MLANTAAHAQSTDGYHSHQVIPLVADTGSFTSSFNFTTPNLSPVTVTPRFHPGKNGIAGDGTTIGTVSRIVTSRDGTVRSVLVTGADGERRRIRLAPGTLSVNGDVVTTTSTRFNDDD
jgi:hypothetical protein